MSAAQFLARSRGFRALAIFAIFTLGAVSQSAAQAGGRNFNRDYTGVKQIFAEITTHEGTMKLELFFKDAPNTVANFIHLTDSGVYKGLAFHRIIEGFMAQTGDPNGDGTGGPSWKLDDEQNSLTHEAGSVSMANAGPNTAGSQFFICHMPQSHLNGRHTVFGKLVSGFDVLTRLERGDPMLDVKVIEVK
jgi:peptidyl-prolyl cis-trans isomerase B (cyclophilin B)